MNVITQTKIPSAFIKIFVAELTDFKKIHLWNLTPAWCNPKSLHYIHAPSGEGEQVPPYQSPTLGVSTLHSSVIPTAPLQYFMPIIKIPGTMVWGLKILRSSRCRGRQPSSNHLYFQKPCSHTHIHITTMLDFFYVSFLALFHRSRNSSILTP